MTIIFSPLYICCIRVIWTKGNNKHSPGYWLKLGLDLTVLWNFLTLLITSIYLNVTKVDLKAKTWWFRLISIFIHACCLTLFLFSCWIKAAAKCLKMYKFPLKKIKLDKNHLTLILCFTWHKVTRASRQWRSFTIWIFYLCVLLHGQLSPGRCCLSPCLPSWDVLLTELREGKGEGEEEPSQEAPGPRPSLDPQPRVTEHPGSAGPAQPPHGVIAWLPDRGGGVGRRPPPVSCVINI